MKNVNQKEIKPLYDGQPQMPEGGIFLGYDEHGFQYFQCPDRYIYQVYPNFDYWVNGQNRKNMFNGYVAYITAWEHSIKNILHTK